MTAPKRFHAVCCPGLTMSEDQYEVVTRYNPLAAHSYMTFSSEPLPPGDTFPIYVTAASMHRCSLRLGFTATDPAAWDGVTMDTELPGTWTMDTDMGILRLDGKIGVCTGWENMENHIYLGLGYMDPGDILRLTLCEDGTASIEYERTDPRQLYCRETFTEVFTDLPRVPLWPVVVLNLEGIRILSYDAASLRKLCLRKIRKQLTVSDIHILPLPESVKQELFEYDSNKDF